MRRLVFLMMLALAVSACGDAETTDTRGYTKAPLEDPDLLISKEPVTPMAALGEPDLPRPATDLQPPSGGEAGASAQEQPQVTLAPGVTQSEFDQGREVFTGVGGCQACHGPSAGGGPLAPNLSDSEWLHVSGPNVDEIEALVRAGVPNPVSHPAPMPPMGGANLTDQQVRAVAAYVASIGQS